MVKKKEINADLYNRFGLVKKYSFSMDCKKV